MALNPTQQISELVKKCSHPLILIPQNPEGDAVASALAFSLILKKMDKLPEVSCPTAIAERFLFLPGVNSISHNLTAERIYKISLNVEDNQVTELSYEQVGSILNIFLSIKNDNLKRESLDLAPSKFKYDLVIIFGSPDLESLGHIYFENTELFFQTPIINIDHHASNEYFGTVNMVEVTRPSTSEITAEIAKALLPEEKNADLSTLLLAGVIAETNNFQTPNISPETFTLAASLLSAGANQEEIIKYFYKTKPLAVLKLIGLIINNINFDADYHLAWAHISQDDFIKNEVAPRDIDMAIDELVNNSKDIDILVLAYEDASTLKINIWSDKKYDASRLAEELGGEKKDHKVIVSAKEPPAENFERQILEKTKSFIKESNKKSG